MDASLMMAVALVAAAAVALELRVSSAFLEIIAGIVLGALVTDLHEVTWLELLADLGMIALMFTAGFEVDMRRLRWMWRGCVGVGVSSFLAPFVGVFALAHWAAGLDPLAAALVGVAMSTTSLALVYPALKERGMLRTAQGQGILASATVVDVISMVALAALLGDAGWGTAIVVIVLAGTYFGLPRAGQWVFSRYKGSQAEPELRFLLVVLIALGFTVENVGGIHPATVAFAVGVGMSRVVVEHEAVEQKLKGLVFGLFAPVFFLHAGTQLDLTAITPEVLVTAAALLVVATALKFAGTAYPARKLMGINARMAGLIFNYRLSFGIVAAGTGLEAGVLGQGDYAAIVLAVLTSAILPAVLLRHRPSEVPTETGEDQRAVTWADRSGEHSG